MIQTSINGRRLFGETFLRIVLFLGVGDREESSQSLIPGSSRDTEETLEEEEKGGQNKLEDVLIQMRKDEDGNMRLGQL